MKEPAPDKARAGRLLGGCALLLLCGGIALLAPAAARLFRPVSRAVPPVTITPLEQAGMELTPRPADGKQLPTPTIIHDGYANIPSIIDSSTLPEQATGDLQRLFTVTAPIHEYFTAAEELGRSELGERTAPATPQRLGDRATFYTADGPREAELLYADNLATYWAEAGLALDVEAIVAAAERLRTGYYPLLEQQFGQEWQPGVDLDPRIVVLHVLGAADTHELGYFIDENQYPRALFAQSNEREMIYLNMSRLEPGTPLYDGTLVHEMQHLIQWNLDANEDKWLNEGLSQVAEVLVGLDTVDPRPYLEQTYLRLDRWSDAAPDVYAHYAGSYLYTLYLWEQLGDAALTELARHPADGLAAVRAVLAGHQPDRSLEQFTADWATALYLDDRSPDARFNVRRHTLPPPFFANRVRQLPFESVATLAQFGVDYIDLDFSGPATLTFAGDTVVTLIDAPPGGGSFWYAPPGDSRRAQLTTALDLKHASNAALSFRVWHDLEAGFDFAYLSISTDGGETWRPLEPNHGLLGAYGPAWGGHSTDTPGHTSGWLQETIDLSAFGGQSVLLRFDVVTDFEQSGRGFAVSDLLVSGTTQQPVWQTNGFVDTGHLLPQQWAVRLICNGEPPEVVPLALDQFNRGQVTIELGREGGALVVVPLTPFVNAAADYWLAVNR